MLMEEPTHQPARVIAGHCPSCGEVVVVFNNHETWPLVQCRCGWQGATTSVYNRIRLERNSVRIGPDHPDY